jgi:ABC-type multidrug transport system ATPase subunit
MSLIIQKLKLKSLITLGRSVDCDIVFKSQSVSQFHATIEKIESNKYIIKDTNSENGVFVNGKKIHGPEIISKTDAVYIGRYRFSIEAGPENLSNETAIRVDNIIVSSNKGFFKQKKETYLHSTTLEIQKQSLVAILGPSGCGKSTLLKALCGDSKADKGNVYIFGLELEENIEYLKTQIGYVPQDDIVHGDLTVIESLYYAARLRLPNLTRLKIDKKINDVLTLLNIIEIKFKKVNKLSGGQRKRVCIGVELLSEPQILFLDEPTSPLDPQTISDFLEALKNLTLKGTTIVMVTHKPEELQNMDKAIFMAEGGQVVYYDNSDSFLDYFGVIEPVQVYPNLIGDSSIIWKKKYKTLSNHSEIIDTSRIKLDIVKTDNLSQYFWLVERYFKIKTSDKKNFIWLIGQAIIIPCLISILYDSFSISVCFFIVISSLWFGTNNSVREIISEEKIFKRERMFNQKIYTYLLSKLTVLTFISIIQSFLFTLILYYRFNLKDSLIPMNEPKLFFLWIILLSIIASLLGLVLSAFVKSTEKAMTILPLTLLPQILFAGIIVPIKSIWIELLSYLSFSRWGTEGAALIQKNVAVPQYQIKPGSLYIDPLTNKNTKPEIVKMNKDAIMDASNKISENFHDSYKMIFSELNTRIILDIVALIFIGAILFSILYFAVKQKDSMKLY